MEIHPHQLGGHYAGICRDGACAISILLPCQGVLTMPTGPCCCRRPCLHPEVMRLAFVFLLVGFGTKAGIAPMHTWLPDPLEAPSPLSAMMSGVSSQSLCMRSRAGRWWWTQRWAPPFESTASVAGAILRAGAFSLVIQRNYKRMLAYSSIEHTGLICIGLGLGPLGVFAAFLHLVCHTAASPCCSFYQAKCCTVTAAQNWNGSRPSQPRPGQERCSWAECWSSSGPAFRLVHLEFALIRAGFAIGRPGLMAAVLALLAVGFRRAPAPR